MPHLAITGASVGIGRATTIALADRFDRITLLGRSPDRHRDVLGTIPHADLVECDLASLASVATAVDAVEGDIDVIITNAGVAGVRGITQDGFELHFGVNHLAHFLLVTSLAARIADRVVVVSSAAFEDAAGIDWSRVQRKTTSLTGFEEYRQSKLANVWFARELNHRTGIPTHIVHPGMVASQIWRRVPQPFRALMNRRLLTPEQGAQTSVHAATGTGLEPAGYLSNSRPRRIPDVGLDAEGAAELWDRSESWVARFVEDT